MDSKSQPGAACRDLHRLHAGGLHVLVLRGLCVEGKAAIIAMLSRRDAPPKKMVPKSVGSFSSYPLVMSK
jgi:hypothetical protein